MELLFLCLLVVFVSCILHYVNKVPCFYNICLYLVGCERWVPLIGIIARFCGVGIVNTRKEGRIEILEKEEMGYVQSTLEKIMGWMQELKERVTRLEKRGNESQVRKNKGPRRQKYKLPRINRGRTRIGQNSENLNYQFSPAKTPLDSRFGLRGTSPSMGLVIMISLQR